MFAHLNPHSSDFWYPCALYSPFLHQLTMQSSLFEPGCPVLVVVCVARKLHPCPSYSRRRDRINLGLWRSLYKGGAGYVRRWWCTLPNHVTAMLHQRLSAQCPSGSFGAGQPLCLGGQGGQQGPASGSGEYDPASGRKYDPHCRHHRPPFAPHAVVDGLVCILLRLRLVLLHEA